MENLSKLTAFVDKNFGGGLSNVVNKVKGHMLNYSEIQFKVDEATNNDKCKCFPYSHVLIPMHSFCICECTLVDRGCIVHTHAGNRSGYIQSVSCSQMASCLARMAMDLIVLIIISRDQFHEIMDMIYLKLQERDSNWRQCYKVTLLFIHLHVPRCVHAVQVIAIARVFNQEWLRKSR